jgi:hypothetical protein
MGTVPVVPGRPVELEAPVALEQRILPGGLVVALAEVVGR